MCSQCFTGLSIILLNRMLFLSLYETKNKMRKQKQPQNWFSIKNEILKNEIGWLLIKKAAIWSFHNNLQQLSTDMQSAAFL